MVAAAAIILGTGLAARTSAQPPTAPAPASPQSRIQRIDRASLVARFRAAGHKKIGGVSKEKCDSRDTRVRSLPHFSSSFSFGGVRYPYTMLGYPPASGRTARLKSVIVPLRMNFLFFRPDPVVFEPTQAVNNIVKSPIFNDAQYPIERGQFGDAFQRATFWNRMDPQRRWHTQMVKPRVAKPITIQVEPDIGEIFQVGPDPGDLIGNVRIGAMDSQLHTIIQLTDLEPDEVPIFVTGNVIADALGFHDAFASPNDDDTETLQTLIYASWLDPTVLGDIFADVSTLSHEVAEWLDDPFVNNLVPDWAYPPKNLECAFNPFLEVGDPQGNGPDFELFPNFTVKLNNYNYHLQNLVMLPWFARESPSTAVNGTYSFPDATQIKTPSAPCPPGEPPTALR
jgi:hypothetical protein